MFVNLLSICLRRLILVTPRNVSNFGEVWVPAAGISKVYRPDYLDTTKKNSAAALEKNIFLPFRTDDDPLTVDIWIEQRRRLPHGKFQSCVSTTQWKCFVPHAPEIHGQQSNAKSLKTYSTFFRSKNFPVTPSWTIGKDSTKPQGMNSPCRKRRTSVMHEVPHSCSCCLIEMSRIKINSILVVYLLSVLLVCRKHKR